MRAAASSFFNRLWEGWSIRETDVGKFTFCRHVLGEKKGGVQGGFTGCDTVYDGRAVPTYDRLMIEVCSFRFVRDSGDVQGCESKRMRYPLCP